MLCNNLITEIPSVEEDLVGLCWFQTWSGSDSFQWNKFSWPSVEWNRNNKMCRLIEILIDVSLNNSLINLLWGIFLVLAYYVYVHNGKILYIGDISDLHYSCTIVSWISVKYSAVNKIRTFECRSFLNAKYRVLVSKVTEFQIRNRIYVGIAA